jgi:hypothetical protein
MKVVFALVPPPAQKSALTDAIIPNVDVAWIATISKRMKTGIKNHTCIHLKGEMTTLKRV